MLHPVETGREGIYLAGCCQGPKERARRRGSGQGCYIVGHCGVVEDEAEVGFLQIVSNYVLDRLFYYCWQDFVLNRSHYGGRTLQNGARLVFWRIERVCKHIIQGLCPIKEGEQIWSR